MDAVTSTRLVEAAIELFGRDGFEAVTTRAIAEAAGAQQSAISYHFGAKEQLYLACAEHIAQTMRSRLSPLLGEFDRHQTPTNAKAAVATLLSAFLTVMLDEAIAPAARFVVREQMSPTPAFGVMWEHAIRPMAEPLVECLSVVANGKADSATLRLRAFTLVGQVFAFRFGRASLARITGWNEIGPDEFAAARDVVLANARAILNDLVPKGRKA